MISKLQDKVVQAIIPFFKDLYLNYISLKKKHHDIRLNTNYHNPSLTLYFCLQPNNSHDLGEGNSLTLLGLRYGRYEKMYEMLNNRDDIVYDVSSPVSGIKMVLKIGNDIFTFYPNESNNKLNNNIATLEITNGRKLINYDLSLFSLLYPFIMDRERVKSIIRRVIESSNENSGIIYHSVLPDLGKVIEYAYDEDRVFKYSKYIDDKKNSGLIRYFFVYKDSENILLDKIEFTFKLDNYSGVTFTLKDGSIEEEIFKQQIFKKEIIKNMFEYRES